MNQNTPSAQLRQMLVTCAALFAASTAMAQSTADTQDKPKEETYKLSLFQVIETQNTGYVAEAATPFKTKQQIVDIPQAITVITRDMIQDISGYDSSDVLPYAGAVPKFGTGETFQLRGSNTGATYPLLDGQIDRSVFSDNVVIDSIEVIRGPAALLYPNSSLSGVINKTTRRPQSRASNSVQLSVTDSGLYRSTFDSTGPIGKLGSGELDYRLIGGYQGGDTYFVNTKDERTLIHPSLQWNSKNTTVYIAVDYQKLVRPSNPTGLLQPNGVIFTGLGLKNSLLLPPNASETHIEKGFRGSVVQRLGENWETVVGVNADDYHRTGSIVLPLNANWDTRSVGFFNRLNDIQLNHDSISIDTNGTYELFGMKNQTKFGMNITVQKAITKLYTNTDFGGPGATFNNRPIDNPNVNTLPVKPFNAYVAPANPGSRIRSEFSNFYVQQSIDVLPDRLTLIGGVAKYKDETTNQSNYTLNTGLILGAEPLLYRTGVVLHFFNKALTFYAMQAGNQLPPTTSTLVDGSVAPAAQGKGKEVGVKLKLFDGKLNTTISYFDMKTTGLTVFGGVLPSGITYVIPLGSATQRGFDGDITANLSREWQLVGTFYFGSVHNQAGLPVDDSYRSSVSLFTKYRFIDGGLKGLSIGGGAFQTTGRVTSTSALTYANKPAFITNKAEPVATLFATYEVNKNWFVKVQANNLLDKVYAVGINSATLDTPGAGRSFTFHVGYSF
ncbi:MAG: TonB-dependent receptor plug domain-containing protein [Luteolibacter sp.]